MVLMTTLGYVLIFAVGYPLVTLAVWSIGAFGIAATMPERAAAARTRAEAEWSPGGSYRERYTITYRRIAVVQMSFLALAAGLFWPAALPVYFGWKKGTFVADALTKRDARDEAARKVLGS